MSTETHETATGASAVVQRGEYGRKVIEQCHIIYPLHELRLVREEADGYKADAAYWEGKATDGGS